MQATNTSQKEYYSHAAYDSTRTRRLLPVDNSKLGFMEKVFRRNKLDNHGSAQCGEFFSDYREYQLIAHLKESKAEIDEFLKTAYHHTLYWQSFRNPRAVISVLTKLMLIFSIITWITVIFVSAFAGYYWAGFFLTPEFLFFVSIPGVFSVTYAIGKFILGNNYVNDKNNIYFCRRTGLVSFPGKGEAPAHLPFDEFDGYMGSTVNPSGTTDHHLILAHRYSSSFVQNPGGTLDEWRVWVQWEYLQRFMDISKPLPDVPGIEPFRSKDPVTAEYDKKHNRPKRYWRNMDDKSAKRMWKASEKAAEHFPWGLTRELALADGWRPSGFGEGDWLIDSEEQVGPRKTDSLFDDRKRIL